MRPVRRPKKPWIKICRVQTVQGALLACHAGVDYIGMHVINRMSRWRALRFNEILRALSYFRACNTKSRFGPCHPVLVTQSNNHRTIASWFVRLPFEYVQLHSQSLTPRMVNYVRSSIESSAKQKAKIIKTVILKAPDELRGCRKWSGVADAMLFDSEARGGTGTKADWGLIARARRAMPEMPVFVAGGIRPEDGYRALVETHADGIDVQSFSEIRRRRTVGSQRLKHKKRKHITKVLGLVASVRRRGLNETFERYVERRAANVRLLLAPSDLTVTEARFAIRQSENLLIDGLQIDASDNSFVEAWPIDAVQWARRCWDAAPEVPLWIHLFSKSLDFVLAVVDSVSKVNPHLIGIFLQCPPDEDAFTWLRKWRKVLTAVSPILVSPSLSARHVLQLGAAGQACAFKQMALSVSRVIQITAPAEGHSLGHRAARLKRALSLLRVPCRSMGRNWRIGLDRGISLEVLKRMRQSPPDFITSGRGLVRGQIAENVGSFQTLLRAAPQAGRRQA